jgi:MFS family permease
MTESNPTTVTGEAPGAKPVPVTLSSPWPAALAIVPILATVYQTLVLTDVTDDVIRKGIEGEHYAMIWTTVSWGLATLYGVFAGIWAMPRFGSRNTLFVGLILFALGNLLCGAAFDVASLSAAKLVEGLGKGMVIVLCRALLYRQFARCSTRPDETDSPGRSTHRHQHRPRRRATTPLREAGSHR